jgi:hypothetical protein
MWQRLYIWWLDNQRRVEIALFVLALAFGGGAGEARECGIAAAVAIGRIG